MSRYDYFISELYNDPNAVGYIVLYGDRAVEGRNLNYIKFIMNYSRFRRFDINRITIVRGENQSVMKMQFWIVPPGAAAPQPEREYAPEKITATTRFDVSWADFHKSLSGKLEVYSDDFYDQGCGFAPNFSAFADALLAQQELTGYLIVYTKFGQGRQRGNRVANYAVNDLIKNYKVPRSRLKTIYGGNREEPEIELWFVPKNANPPTPDSKPKK